MRAYLLAAIALLLAFTVAQAAVYRWVDAQGHVHYSDKPAPGAKRTDIHSSPTDPKAVEARQKAREKTLAAYAKENDKRAKAQDKADKEAAKRAAECKQARAKLTQLEQARRVTRTDKAGNKTYLDAAQITAARDKAQARVDKLCNAAG